jgi:hypothetical protein
MWERIANIFAYADEVYSIFFDALVKKLKRRRNCPEISYKAPVRNIGVEHFDYAKVENYPRKG